MYKFLCGIFILLISGFFFKKIRRHVFWKRQTNVFPTNPLREILRNLRIVKKNISVDSDESTAMMLSEILKKFLKQTFRYINFEMTNTEILKKLNQDAKNDWETLSLITEIFSLTEQVKFAKRRLSTQQQLGIYKKTCQVILKIWGSKRRQNASK